MNVFCLLSTVLKRMWGVLSYAQHLRFNGGTFVHTVNTVPHKWGESPSPLKHFNIYVQLSLHTFLPCMRSVEKQSEESESTG